MESMVEKGLGDIAESCYEDVPASLCHDEEGNMRSAYEMCELPALNCAVTKFSQCVNMQVVSVSINCLIALYIPKHNTTTLFRSVATLR